MHGVVILADAGMQLDVAHNVVDGLGHVGDVLFTH